MKTSNSLGLQTDRGAIRDSVRLRFKNEVKLQTSCNLTFDSRTGFKTKPKTIFIENRGYYPKGGGEVVVKVTPVKELSPINMTERGNITKIYGRAFVAGVLPFKVQDNHRQ